jgi:hypothetical protein
MTCTFMIMSSLFLLRMRNVSDKSCRGNKTHISCSTIFFQKILWLMK